ncbi:MAG: TIGR01459 family HAD-type hydrolase [Rhodobacteraceae bacterium]|nr:TIGR01459 family HAD-type hydrolase [Paracoccaceae bacterium]
MTTLIQSFRTLAPSYRALFFDIWGCLHNGVTPYHDAVGALQEFVSAGGYVVLLTNSPRPNTETARQIDAIGVDPNCWHLIVTSGDAACASLFAGEVGTRIHHIGKPEEDVFFDPALAGIPDAKLIERVLFDDADGIVCTGPFPGKAHTIDPYKNMLKAARKRNLPMLCANPDQYVDRGGIREICAGLIASHYAELGGTVRLYGKPGHHIYTLARQRLRTIAPAIRRDEILCIGDGIATDIPGARSAGFASLFVSGGLAAVETGTRTDPDPELLRLFLAKNNIDPDYTIGTFRN